MEEEKNNVLKERVFKEDIYMAILKKDFEEVDRLLNLLFNLDQNLRDIIYKTLRDVEKVDNEQFQKGIDYMCGILRRYL